MSEEARERIAFFLVVATLGAVIHFFPPSAPFIYLLYLVGIYDKVKDG